MRVSKATLLLALVGGSHAFAPSAPFGVASSASKAARFSRPMSDVAQAEAAVEEVGEVQQESPAPSAAPAASTSSGLTMNDVRTTIRNLTAENFASSLDKIEPFLLHEAGSSIYSKSIKRIAVKANLLGVQVPADYALDAKATSKRREKQNEFVKTKEEDARAVAEAAATEAMEAAEASDTADAEEEPESADESVEA